jgi:hypothetical protein
MEELASRLLQMETRQQELLQGMQQQQGALGEQTRRTEQAEAGLRNAAVLIETLRATSTSAPASVQAGAGIPPLPQTEVRSSVDTRTLGKPSSFGGRREAWREFRFVFEAFACAAHPHMMDLFRGAEAMNERPIARLDPLEPKEPLSRQLYYMLVMLTTDDAHRLMTNVEQGNGAEAWRRLCWEYEPNVRVRHGAVLHALLRREFGKDPSSDLAVEIETFERDVRRWEEQSGKTLDPDIKVSVLMGGMANAKVRDHLELNAARLDTYDVVRAEVLNFAVARRTWATELDDPMVIGALKGKGKDGKRKHGAESGPRTNPDRPDKDQRKGGKKGHTGFVSPTLKGDGKGDAGKECFYCKKLGHLKADCRKLAADIASGKVQPKPKTQPHPRPGARSVTSDVSSLSSTPMLTDYPQGAANPWPPGSGGQMWVPMSATTAGTLAAIQAVAPCSGTMMPRHSSGLQPHPSALSPRPTGTSEAPWMISMIRPLQLMATLRVGDAELALIDSGSGVVACPKDYAPEVPMLPVSTNMRPMVSATNEPIIVYGRKIVHYTLDNGEEMSITWNVTNVNCLIVAARALSRGGATLVLAPERDMLHTASGGCVDLVKDGDVPWLKLRRQRPGVRAVREPMAVEEADPPETRAVPFDNAPAVPAAVAVMPAPAAHQGPAPLDASEEARAPRGVKVPEGPTPAEKDQHYLTHIPFRAWCSYCTRAAAPEDGHQRGRGAPDRYQKPIVMMDYTFITDMPRDMLTVLTVYDVDLGMVLPVVVDEKGPIQYAIRSVCENLGHWGRKDIILRVDGEPAIKALAEAIRLARPESTVIEVKPRYSPESMGAVENMNKELKNIVRCFALQLKDEAKMELHTNHPLLPWLVRHSGWCICMYRVRSDGRTAYERLKGRPYSGKIALFGECLWYRTPDAMQLSSLDERWTTCIWVGKGQQSDEHILIVGDEVRLARSVRRKATGKRWNKTMLQKVLCTPWLPRLDPHTPAARPPRYITKAYMDKHGRTPECPGCIGRTTGHSDTCKARFQTFWDAEDRAALGVLHDPAPAAPAAVADPSMQPAAAPAAAEASAASPAAMPVDVADTSMQPSQKRAREDASSSGGPAMSDQDMRIGALAVCALGTMPPPEESTMICYVATTDIGRLPVKDHKTGETLDPDLALAGRRDEKENMMKRNLYDRVRISDARGKKVRSMWLDEARSNDDGAFVRSRCVAMEFSTYDRLDTYAGTPPLKFVKLIISRAATRRKPGEVNWTRLIALYDIVTAFWHADLPVDEPITVIPPRGEEEPGWVWQMKKAMYGTRRASMLFLEFMVTALSKCGYVALKITRQVFYNAQNDSMAALHGDDIIAEGESEALDRLDAALTPLCHLKVLPRVGPGGTSMGRYLKRYICYVPDMGYEWNEDPKHVVTIITNRGKAKAKPQGSPASKEVGKSDPKALDELCSEAMTEYRSDSGRILYISSGRFDLQYTSKLLGEQMSTPLRLGDARLERCARYLVGCAHLSLVFKHEEEVAASTIHVDSSWADDLDRYSTHAGCEFVGSHLIESWVATDQVRALSTAEAELYGIVDGSARGIMTQNLFEEIGIKWNIEVGCDSSAAISISSKSGVGKTRHIATRWLWVQDAVRNKQIRLKKIDGLTNVSDMGTKPLEPKRHQELMKQLPLAPPLCRRFLAVLALLLAIPPGEGGKVAIRYQDPATRALACRGQEASYGQQFMQFILLVVVISATVGAVRVYDRIKEACSGGGRAANTNKVASVTTHRSVGTQSQTTYTAVRGVLQPRFQVLPEYSHG